MLTFLSLRREPLQAFSVAKAQESRKLAPPPPPIRNRSLLQPGADGAPVIERAAFDGYACTLCAACADALLEHAEGMRVRDAAELSLDDVLALWGGLEVGRTRRGCVELPLVVLKRALVLLQ